MGALFSWLPSSLQIGRLRGDRVGWREVCVRVCVCVFLLLLGYSERALKAERRENSDSIRQTKPLFGDTVSSSSPGR